MARLLFALAAALLLPAAAAAALEGMPLPPPFERGRIGLQVQPMRVAEGGKLALGLVRDGKPLEVEVAPEGQPWPDAEAWRDWMRGGFHHGMDALQRRLDELERRLDELERRTPEAKPT